jgi:predicted methyltransferase
VPETSSKQGYLPEAWLVEQVQAAGFKLVAKSEVNANPKDTKDYPEGVWSLPPTLREGDKDRAKYLAVGESDRMTLKFVKVTLAKPGAVPAAK